PAGKARAARATTPSLGPRMWVHGWESASDSRRPPRSESHRAIRLESNASAQDRKSTRLNSSHVSISYAVFCLKKKKKKKIQKKQNKLLYTKTTNTTQT